LVLKIIFTFFSFKKNIDTIGAIGAKPFFTRVLPVPIFFNYRRIGVNLMWDVILRLVY